MSSYYGVPQFSGFSLHFCEAGLEVEEAVAVFAVVALAEHGIGDDGRGVRVVVAVAHVQSEVGEAVQRPDGGADGAAAAVQ